MYFIRRKRDSNKNLIFIVNIKGLRIKVKKVKIKNIRDINIPKDNIKETYISNKKEK